MSNCIAANTRPLLAVLVRTLLLRRISRKVVQFGLLVVFFATHATAQPFQRVRVSDDGNYFAIGESQQRFVVWGVNYDHNSEGELLDEYWIERWEEVVEDFAEMKALGANCVRIHLQFGKFMNAADQPNQTALDQLAKLLKLAEETGLYLDITGLACYHKANVPEWFDRLSEQDRWKTQALFWGSIAQVCRNSPAVFCYDLMNEPILPGKRKSGEPAESQWLGGELGGKFFVQRLALDLAGRTRQQVAKAWVDQMVDAIREQDELHMITVGVIPWVFVFGGGKPLFYSSEVGERLDFVSVHFYPEKGQVEEAITALRAYDIGKPLVVEEMFPMKCSVAELEEFVSQSSEFTDGWISFYWGKTADQLNQKSNPTIAEAITASWLQRFQSMAEQVTKTK
ncbi:cellulase family glycosylhydrolase [Rosistilla oblonga]|uniref:Cellulase (Glycosyl hydrolase family 5) n=1 Tax=Rosistilla oblonga TaxID=2527990 RepID=A0A518IT81_9BACT|nr:cellulase family glycosylhydrolase [Rosistilla oblonga]QDV56291.1 Cellulase (glycosyl hydrolase family 5) [Rosistilla oblonga]